MERIPDEVLEFILGFLPPYDDLQKCLLVSKRWAQCARNVINKTSIDLYRAIVDFDIIWDSISPIDLANTIAKRYSHSTVVDKNSMYVFGGCTCTSTTFNDLWKFNLSTRQFERLLTTGTYPSPKACASMVCHNNTLILFGGWAHPSPYPLHQSWKLFDELHIYNINQNRWLKQIGLDDMPPPMAGHSATVHNNIMIVFGGLQKHHGAFDSQFSSSNDIWCLDLITFLWYKQSTSAEKPMPRYGQSQIYLDSEHLLIIGGCGGTNLIYSDCWLLAMNSNIWKWRKVQIFNTSNGPANIWCNQACKVGDKLVILSQGKIIGTPLSLSCKWNLPNQIKGPPPNRLEDDFYEDDNDIPIRFIVIPDKKSNSLDIDENINGKYGQLQSKNKSNTEKKSEPSTSKSQIIFVESDEDRPSTSKDNLQPGLHNKNNLRRGGMLASKNKHSQNNNHSERLRRLDVVSQRLKRYEEVLKRGYLVQQLDIEKLRKKVEAEKIPAKKHKRNQLSIFVLDISNVNSEECSATWMQNDKNIISKEAPEETILYSLVAGKGELIMFGGIQRDATSCMLNIASTTEQVSNTLHFIRAPKCVI